MNDNQRVIDANKKLHREAVKQQMRDAPPSVISAQHILELAISGFGGPEAYAALLVTEFRQAKAGSHVRARIIAILDNLTQFCAKHYAKDQPFNGFERDDLLDRLDRIMDGREGTDAA